MRRVAATDAVAAAALAAFMVAVSAAVRTTQPHARPLAWWGVALLIAGGAALALRRPAPYLAYGAAVGAAVAYLALRQPGWPVYVGALAGLLVVVSERPDRRWALPAALGGVGLAVATGPPEGWSAPRMIGIAIVWAAAAVLADRLAQVRRRVADADAARLVAEERLRIARELHDVLSHSLAAISLHAGVGLHLVERQPVPAREALTAIRQISNDALAQARSALAGVRDPDGTPGLGELPGLVESFRASGMAIELRAAPVPQRIPPAVGSAVFRIVQEALTNVMRHAGPHVRVEASVGPDEGCLRVEVRDNGSARAPVGPPGHGLRGMRERVEGLGGTCSAGFEDGAGFVVRARLPIASSA